MQSILSNLISLRQAFLALKMGVDMLSRQVEPSAGSSLIPSDFEVPSPFVIVSATASKILRRTRSADCQ